MIAQTERIGNLGRVDRIKGDVPVRDIPLCLGRQVGLQLSGIIGTVDEIGPSGTDLLRNIVLVEIGGVMAGDEIRRLYIVGGTDRPVRKAQMASGKSEGLLGVILEIGLGEFVRVVIDDLHGIFVGAHSAVGAKAPELAADRFALLRVKRLVHFQGSSGNVVCNADREAVFRIFLIQFLKDGEDLSRRGVLGGQAVAAADHSEVSPAAERRTDVGIERLARASVLLGAVQHRDLPAGLRDGGKETGDVEGTVEVHLDETGLFALGVQMIHHLLDTAGDRSHGDDHALRVRRAVVIKYMIFPACDLRELSEIVLHDIGQSIIVRIAGFPDLEEYVGILDRSTQHGVLRIQRLGPEGVQGIKIIELLQILIVDLLYLVDLVRRAESVEEMNEGNPGFNARQMRDCRQIHDFLHTAGREEGKARVPGAHNIRVIAENRHGVRTDRSRGHMQDAREPLAGNTVHKRQHQHQALGGSKTHRQASGLQSAVDSARRTRFGLHFNELDPLPEQVLFPVRRPDIGFDRHRRGWRDRINRSDFSKRVRHIGTGFVSVYSHVFFYFFCHNHSLSVAFRAGRTVLQGIPAAAKRHAPVFPDSGPPVSSRTGRYQDITIPAVFWSPAHQAVTIPAAFWSPSFSTAISRILNFWIFPASFMG